MTTLASTQTGPGAMARPEAEKNTNRAPKVGGGGDPRHPPRIRRRRLGQRAVAWREDEVSDWIASRPRASIGQSTAR